MRALAADGVSQREIAARLGLNRRTVRRMVESEVPPRYARAPAGSMLDPLEPVLARLLEEWPLIKAPRVTEILRADYGYAGSVDLVRRRLQQLRPRAERPAQRTGYRPGQVLQLDWSEMPTRPRIAGRERRVYALVGSLPYSGAQTAHFGFDMTLESFLEGHARIFDWLRRGPRVRLRQPALGRCAARARGRPLEPALSAPAWPLRLSTPPPARRRRRARRGRSRARCAISRRASGRHGGSPRSPISTSSSATGAIRSATSASTRPGASRSPSGSPWSRPHPSLS